MDGNSLEIIVSVTQIVLFLTLTILAIFIISSMKKFLSSVAKIESEVMEVSEQLGPVIADMKYITDDVRMIVDRSRIQFEKIEKLSGEVVQKGTGLVNTIDKIQNVSSSYLNNTLNLVSAITKGFQTFGDKLKFGSYFHKSLK